MSGRDWLIAEDAVRDPAARAVFEAAVAQVNDGTAKVDQEYPPCLVVDGRKVLGSGVLEFALAVPAAEFDAEAMWAFVERLRRLLGWNELDYELELWVEARLRDPFFVNTGSDWDQVWERLPVTDENDPADIPPAFFDFACRVAIGDLKYGPSYAYVGSNRIFDWVTRLGSTLPAKLKKHGTGDLPPALARLRTEHLTASANDALAVIRLALNDDSEAAYRDALDYLYELLRATDFPRSYAIEFRGPKGAAKTWLPIKGLPKKGVHLLFAQAAAYPALHPLIEAYAQVAMGVDEWYQNLDDEDCAMPGTFAVFALGLADGTDAVYAPLVLDYLRAVDGEHQSMQAKFVEAYVDAHGFTPEALAYLVACAGNIQHLRHRTSYPTLIANRASLEALAALRGTSIEGAGAASGIGALRANLAGEPVEEYAWRAALHAIWGEAAERDHGTAIIATAPDELRALYERVLS